jgi:Putative beta-barrel porin-2, OmpL-like. bbp2
VSAIVLTKVAVAVLCGGAIIFFLRVLIALVKELRIGPASAVKVYFAKFNPSSRKRGELIVMNSEILKGKPPIKVGKRTALMLLAASFFAFPLRAQQVTTDNSNKNESSGSNASDGQIPPAIAKQLSAMEQRIEQLEAELKKQHGGNQASAMADPPVAASPLVPVASAVISAPVNVPGMAAVETQTSPAPTPIQKKEKAEPFAFADFTWLNGNSRVKDVPLDTKFFTPEVQADVDYIVDFNHPADDTIGGSSEVFRANEFQLTQFGAGGDFHYNNVQARLMTQFGMYSATTPRNDASPARGNWDLDTAYRYVSEAYGGYHINAMNGINIQAGIFMSYVGLFSYYNFDNWAYQPSYVSSNTPWFFNGMRVQIFPTEHLKIEPWLINGWQSYGRFNHRPGFGGQILWRPNGNWEVLGNQYALGADTLGVPGRIRYHTDDSIEHKYYDNPGTFISKAAFTVTGDAGCEHGGDPVAGTAVSCDTDAVKIVNGKRYIAPKQSFLGFMVYNRLWFQRDRYGFTLGGGKINNPGRYLVLLPPINGATAISGTPYFPENPGDPFKAWDASATFDYMPSQYITFRWEYDHRAANVPYFTGRGGITPPGGNIGAPGSFVPGFTPNLVKDENRLDLAILVKF